MSAPATAIDESLLSRLSAFVSRRMGLHFPPARWPELHRGLQRAADELEFEDPAGFVQWLESSPVTRDQIEILASHLTVGETYFFREPGCFGALEQQVLPQLIHRRRGQEQRLRIWSAACCTGEEPYSIAVLLRRLLPDLAAWDVTLLATDINPKFLQKAQAGIFGEWSFRHAPPGFQETYFRLAGPGQYELLPEIRNMVRFSYLNLAEDVYPSLLNNTNAMDLILCRNVLIYLAPEQSADWVQKLACSLVEGGWLAVGVVETMHVSSLELTRHAYPGITLFQKQSLAGRVEAPPDLATPWASAPAPVPVDASEVDAAGRPETVEMKSADTLATAARVHANKGRLADALCACDEALALARTDPVLHYLRSAILQEQNELAEAKVSLKRAIYLDPEFVMAHFSLGHLQRRLERGAESARCFQTALELIGDLDPLQVVPHSEGITAGRLKQLIAAQDSNNKLTI
jgi:chemotaxis protein methyltransferase CheR